MLFVTLHGSGTKGLLLVSLWHTSLSLALFAFLLALELIFKLTINIHLSLEKLVTQLECLSMTSIPKEKSHPATETLV